MTALAMKQKGLKPAAKIVTMNADGTGRSVVFVGSPYFKYIDRQVWSPDGTKLAFFDNTIWKYIDMTQYETSAEDTIDIDFKNGYSPKPDKSIELQLFF